MRASIRGSFDSQERRCVSLCPPRLCELPPARPVLSLELILALQAPKRRSLHVFLNNVFETFVFSRSLLSGMSIMAMSIEELNTILTLSPSLHRFRLLFRTIRQCAKSPWKVLLVKWLSLVLPLFRNLLSEVLLHRYCYPFGVDRITVST